MNPEAFHLNAWMAGRNLVTVSRIVHLAPRTIRRLQMGQRLPSALTCRKLAKHIDWYADNLPHLVRIANRRQKDNTGNPKPNRRRIITSLMNYPTPHPQPRTWL